MLKRILISAGDYSADIHGESLVREMKSMDPSVTITSLGGIRLAGVSEEFLRDMVEMDISGVSQPFFNFFELKGLLQKVIFPRLESREFDAVVLIDYYGFNIHIAKKAKELGIPVFYFVSPQVWASRRWRIRKLRETVTKMIVIFPFEETLYRKNGVPVEFVGHPIMDSITWLEKPAPRAGSPDGKICLGLMPGSRQRELIRHAPLMIQCFKILKKRFPNMEGRLFAVDSIPDDVYRSYVRSEPIKIVRESGFESRSELTFCLTASGTATLENALLGIPMIVIYQASWLTYLVARWFIQVPHISMPNILSGREIIPELLQHRASPERITSTAAQILSDPAALEKMSSELLQLRERLGHPGAYNRAARIILNALQPAVKETVRT